MFRYLILGILRNGGALHGYALKKEYADRSGIDVSSGNFYRELQRLAAEGLVRSVANPVDADPRRVPYEITEAGAAAFDAWFAQLTGTSASYYEDDISARALFLPEADPAVAAKVLDRWQEELWYRGKRLERDREAALARSQGSEHSRLIPLTLLLSRRLKYVAADLEFVEQLRIACERSATARRAAEPRAAAPTRVRALKKKAQETPPPRGRR